MPRSGLTGAPQAACPFEARPRRTPVAWATTDSKAAGYENGGMSDAKRQHFVPKFYLERFGESGRVFVRRRDGASFVSSCTRVAAECGFYDLDVGDGQTSKVVEEILGDLEAPAARVFRSIDQSGRPPTDGSTDRATLADYLALQITRTPQHREKTLFHESLSAYAGTRPLSRETVRSFLAEDHLGFPLSDNEVEAAWTFASALSDGPPLTTAHSMRMMFEAIEPLANAISGLHWCIEHERKGHFITSDSPLVLWSKPSPDDSLRGIGIDSAEELRFPLDPFKQLVLTHRRRGESVRVNPSRAATCNQDAAYASHTLVVGNPSTEMRAGQLDLPFKRPTLRFNIGPAVSAETGQDLGQEILHVWTPRK